MVLGKPLRCEISFNGSASPAERKAERILDECITDLTR